MKRTQYLSPHTPSERIRFHFQSKAIVAFTLRLLIILLRLVTQVTADSLWQQSLSLLLFRLYTECCASNF